MLSARTAGRLRLEEALQAELQEPSSLLPSRSVENSVKDDTAGVAEFIAARVSSGLSPTATEVVVAAKSARGFRPVHFLDIEQRVLYRALVDLLAPRVEYPDRSDEAYEHFKRAPLSDSDATHVVRADVASFYQYIDHRVLESEVVSQTSEAQVASTILALLGPMMGRAFGLPQNNGASHALADLYVDAAERQLVRYGQSVWRYNDDFAMATAGLSEARRSLEDLERALRAVGLTPNDEKSVIHTRERYQAWVDRPLDLLGRITDGLSVDLDAWILQPASGYAVEGDGETSDEEPKAQEYSPATELEQVGQVAGAVRTLEEWLDHVKSQGSTDPLERYVYRTLARDAIRLLRRRLSSEGLDYCDSLLAFEPQMTHTVCRYISRIAMVDVGAVDFVADLVGRPDTHLSVWQKVWLLEPLLLASDVPAGLWEWVDAMLDDHSSAMLRARAALVLATHGRISTTRIGSLFDQSTAAAKPDLVVAMVRAADGAQAPVEAIAGANDLMRRVGAYALAQD